MEKDKVYRITKLEKGPLQRFKNQNALIKKFGDVGILVYKAISGKKSNADLLREMEIDTDVLFQVLSFMEEEGMVQLSEESAEVKKEAPVATPEEVVEPPRPKTTKPAVEFEPPAPEIHEEPEMKEEEIAPVEMEKETVKEEERLETRSEEKVEEKAEPEPTEEFEITPIEEHEKPEPVKPISKPTEKQERPAPKSEPKPEEPVFEQMEEITPIDDHTKELEKTAAEEPPEETPKEEVKEAPQEEEITPIEAGAAEGGEETSGEEKTEETKEEYLTQELKVEGGEPEAYNPEEEALSPVEKIIKDKYGDVGIKVYQLIDGQRTAEEIMKETGLTEAKLVEMLDFMDDEGIIKLEYPGDKRKAKEEAPAAEKPSAVPESDTFKPMVEGEEMLDKDLISKNPIEVPIKTPLNMVEALYVRADTLRKFGGNGGKVLESVDGKKDLIELAIENGMALFEIKELADFLLSHHVIMLKPLGRVDIRKKYGDDGYAVFKRYGKDGVFLYELVGKDMKIKDMVKLVYRDVKGNKDKLADMFIFIHQVLKIDLPVDKELLYREFGA